MTNRLSNPNIQWVDEAGLPLAGGKLYFYASGTSTPLATYNDPDLDPAHANTNPVVLDAAGYAGDIFLQNYEYRVTLTDADDVEIWTADPVATDFTNRATISATVGGSYNNYNPSGLAAAGVIRLTLTSDTTLTGLAGGASGRLLTFINTSATYGVIFNDQDGASSSANQFLLPVSQSAAGILAPRASITFIYDSTSSKWRIVGIGTNAAASGDYVGTTINSYLYATPALMHYHPGVAKFWAYVTVSAGTPTLAASYGVTSITDTGTGLLTITPVSAFNNTAWAASVSVRRVSTGLGVANLRYAAVRNAGQAADTILVECWDGTAVTANQVDPDAWYVFGYGPIIPTHS